MKSHPLPNLICLAGNVPHTKGRKMEMGAGGGRRKRRERRKRRKSSHVNQGGAYTKSWF